MLTKVREQLTENSGERVVRAPAESQGMGACPAAVLARQQEGV